MATVKFRLKSKVKKDKNTIYLYLSYGRGKMFEVKSGFSIEPNEWNYKLGFPKKNDAENKVLHSDLKKLELFIHDSINSANSKGELINKLWLESKINECFKRVIKIDSEIFVNHLNYIIENAHTRKVSGKNSLGLSESRIKSYKTFKTIILDYQLHTKETIRLTEINNKFVEDFTKWLLKTKIFSVNYSGKQIDNLKAVCNDAERLGIPTHPQSKNITSFKESDEDRHIITLSQDEIKLISNTKMPSIRLENVKNWILIGVELGQRGEDLINLTKENIRFEKDGLIVDFHQKKTKKDVSVIVMVDEVAEIIKKQLPYPIKLQKLNQYMKEVCKISGINEITEGYKIEVKKVDETKIKRKVFGKFPKHELITSHSLRRSFATKYYKLISTPILMKITGHSRESDFLKYINKQEDKDDNARLFAMQFKMIEKQ